MAYTPLHHGLLDAIQDGAVTQHPGNYHRVMGFRLHHDVELGLFRLLMADHIELGPEPGDGGSLPVLLTPLGAGVLQRWDTEQGLTVPVDLTCPHCGQQMCVCPKTGGAK